MNGFIILGFSSNVENRTVQRFLSEPNDLSPCFADNIVKPVYDFQQHSYHDFFTYGRSEETFFDHHYDENNHHFNHNTNGYTRQPFHDYSPNYNLMPSEHFEIL